ncbi:MAG: hypothetical protein CBC22_02575 [Alphaproteobacteria bacterium TMED62]|nr:MAG: hypothetical protein CBC22_02575 [Alphaproteobacteria bacterium TMED62]
MEKLLILIKLVLLILLLNKTLIAQAFEYSDNYLEAPLIFSHETILEGISKIVPVGGDFSRYSKIELSKVKKDVLEPSAWLKDKIYNETGDIAKLENTLRSKDSPLSDPIFDQFKHLPMHIDNTLEILSSNPLIFCNKVSKQYNKNGVFFELNCTIPFGFFSKYLILRLQFQDMVWYFKKITSLNYYRLKELLLIAETFNVKK